MKVSFRLANKNLEESGITLDFSNIAFKNNRFKYGTGLSVEVKYWNLKAQRAREVGGYTAKAQKINRKLDILQGKVIDFVTDTPELTNEGLKDHLDNKTGVAVRKVQAKENKEPYFSPWAEKFIKSNREELKPSTIATKLQTVNLLNEFKTKIKFKDFGVVLFDSFTEWLRTVKDFSHNSIWKQSKEIKTLLRHADIVEEFKVNSDYKKGLFNMKFKKAENIYLNEEQLEALANLDLSGEAKQYAQARDMFLFGSYTGFRYKEMRSFIPGDVVEINGRQRIKKLQEKTGKEVFIPIFPKVKPFLHEHTLSNPELNFYIKKVAALAEIEEAEQVKAHTARRSFCSNFYKAGVPVMQIMRMSGHAKVKDFLGYIKITAEEHAELTEEHPYFNE